MKGQVLVVLLKLVSLEQAKNEGDAHPGEAAYHDDPYSVRSLESALGISKTEVNASINRSLSSGLAVKDRESGHAKPNRRNLHNFVVHGLKFVFPVKPGAMTRGIPPPLPPPRLKILPLGLRHLGADRTKPGCDAPTRAGARWSKHCVLERLLSMFSIVANT
ncbi:hypothetical protein [Bradyrhizobium sp. NBAIM03]|uniref:hypothetical protein n=1 Tax=Bradyrhizobium sp. NBAIM03 TaxID=2793816 RepID=UPI00201C48E2|nr:hypothetical protein [Bradyrhizobium sp. NBAIM03]